ncbi:MAG: hypothetical protein K0R54_4126 [Clostridiaceae bacterium]|nr:hypothetical protein [Clostridiaceae bacterium]
MIKKIIAAVFLFIMTLNSTVIYADDFKYAEIFDPKQDKVIKVVQINPEIYNMAKSWIMNINDIYGKVEPLTDDGYAVKIPFDPAVEVHGKYLNTIVKEVYLIVPENDPPFFMAFEDADKLLCFPFKGDIDMLSKSLDFNLKASVP